MAGRRLTLGDLVYKLGFENEQQFVQSLDKLMGRAEREVEKGGREAGNRAGRSAGEAFNQRFKATFSGAALGSFLGSALSQAFSSAISAAKQFATESVKEFAVYEQGLLQLKLAGEENLGPLADRIDALAEKSRIFSRTDVSIAIGGLVKAGYDAETAFALVEAGALGAASEVDAATGRFGDLGRTSVDLGNILRALNYDTSESGRVIDVLAKAAQDSNLDVSDLVEIVSRVGPTAKLANLEIEDLAAMAAVLSNNGMDASLISTGLRSVLQSLINPTGEVKDELDALGISLVDRQGNIRDVNDVLDGLHELTQRGGEGLKTLTAATGSYGSTAASSLGQASEAVKTFRTDLENAEGSAQQLADTMRDSAAGSFAEMEARIADAKVELGEQLTPVLVSFYETVLPALVTMLEKVIGLWSDWYFLINGTTPELDRAQEKFEGQFGPGELEVIEHIQELQRARAELEREKNDILAGVGMGGPGAVDDDDRLFISEVLEPEIAKLEEQIRRRRAYFQSLRQQNDAPAGAGAPPPVTPSPGVVPPPGGGGSGTTAGRQVDPIIDEAGRVQRDFQRLKLAYEQGYIGLETYLNSEAGSLNSHVRRLDGLLTQAVSPEQSQAVLRARGVFLDELARLDKEAADEMASIRGVNEGREEDELYPRSATGANTRARAETRAQAEAEAEAEARQKKWEEEVKPALDEIAQQRAKAEEEIYPRSATGANVRAQIERNARVEAAALQEAWESEVKPALDRIAEQRAAAEEEVYPRTATGANVRARFRQGDLAAERASLQQSLRNLNLGAFAASEYVSVLDRARGQVVQLTEAQRTLGQATRDDVRAALEEQVSSIERVLLVTTEGTERYYELVAALEEARASLKALNDEMDVGMAAMPELTDEGSVRAAARAAEAEIASIQAQIAAGPDAALLAALEGRLAFLRALLQVLGQAMADFDQAAADAADAKAIEQQADALAGRIIGIAESFPRAIVEGIQTGDIGAALQNALGNASDFFLDSMLEAILGPIKEQLAAAIAESLAAQQASGAAGGALGALGPTGLVIGGIALVASMFLGANRRRQAESDRSRSSVQRTVSGAPSITYNLSATVQVQPGAGFGDPAFEAQLRSFVQKVAEDLMRRVPRSN